MTGWCIQHQRVFSVSIHTPTKGVTCGEVRNSIVLAGFNPHTHEGCDISSSMSDARADCFNPHTHEGCDLSEERVLLVLKRFNPHTHEGCDILRKLNVKIKRYVSIHTPTKGVTQQMVLTNLCVLFQSTHPRRVWHLSDYIKLVVGHVSIHTPTKGVTSSPIRWHRDSRCFNPHTHEGCDLPQFSGYVLLDVSIHTPTKGVTPWR